MGFKAAGHGAGDPEGALARCVDYVTRYAAICRVDPGQQRYWGPAMLRVVRQHGRRKSAWATLQDAVDREALAGTTTAQVRPEGYDSAL